MKSVSVILPVYNGEDTISSVIESIINQSYSYLELLIVNDGSEDNTQMICEKYAQKDNRIHILNKNSGGVSSARNLGLENSRGDLICFADADDKIERVWIETMVGAMNNCKHDMVICGYEKNNNVSNESYKFGEQKIYDRDMALDVCLGNLGGFLWNKIFKREILERYKIKFNTSICECEDLLFVCEYLMHCKTVASVADILYKYDVSEGNKRSEEKRKSRLIAIACLIELLKRNKCSSKNIRELVAEFIVRGNTYNIVFSRKQMNFRFIEGVKDLLVSQHYTVKEKIYHIYFFGKNYKN